VVWWLAYHLCIPRNPHHLRNPHNPRVIPRRFSVIA
jgi:hypothetical protein